MAAASLLRVDHVAPTASSHHARSALQNQTHNYIESPLATAVRTQDLTALLAALEGGCDTDAPCSLAGHAPLHLAAASGWDKGVETLLSSGASPLARTNAGDTALHWAAFCGHLGALQLLLGAGADVDARGELGNRPLHLAVAGDHSQVRII